MTGTHACRLLTMTTTVQQQQQQQQQQHNKGTEDANIIHSSLHYFITLSVLNQVVCYNIPPAE